MENIVSQFIPLAKETRTHIPTAIAAFFLNRKPQTLRIWAMDNSGPIKPKKINGRLAWKVADILELLNGESTID